MLVDALRLATYSAAMPLPRGFVPPCLPTNAPQQPSGDTWLHEIKHDGFRVIARTRSRSLRAGLAQVEEPGVRGGAAGSVPREKRLKLVLATLCT